MSEEASPGQSPPAGCCSPPWGRVIVLRAPGDVRRPAVDGACGLADCPVVPGCQPRPAPLQPPSAQLCAADPPSHPHGPQAWQQPLGPEPPVLAAACSHPDPAEASRTSLECCGARRPPGAELLASHAGGDLRPRKKQQLAKHSRGALRAPGRPFLQRSLRSAEAADATVTGAPARPPLPGLPV